MWKYLRAAITVAILAASVWFIAAEIRSNADDVRLSSLRMDAGWLLLSFVLMLGGFFAETVSWRVLIARLTNSAPLPIGETIAVYNTAVLLKYVPGRVWTFGAQVLWLRRRSISTAHVMFANVLGLGASALFSTLSSAVSLWQWPPSWAPPWLPAVPIAMAACGVVGLFAWDRLSSALTHIVRLRPLLAGVTGRVVRAGFIRAFLLTIVAWSASGVAILALAKGIGLAMAADTLVPVTAALSASWVIGYLTVLTPGGIGVREGVMLSMLMGVLPIEAALLLPIASRLLSVVAELALGAIGLVVGLRGGYFQEIESANPSRMGPV